MLVSASLSVVFVTKTVAPKFLSADPVSGKSDDGAVTEPVTDKEEGAEVDETAVLAS